ncbi:PAS domain-containing hybrid sensor histidine kinase/response regulator [Dissulfuribacter thermophilus]|nr:PAS domain S-box protein [Dissulfuribacter thermophilus]
MLKNDLRDLPRNITICVPHECQLPGKFFLTFELQWLNPPKELLLLTIKDSNHREILKYIPIIAFTAVHGPETAILTYISPKIQEWTGRHQKEFYLDTKLIYNYVHPEDRTYAIKHLKNFFLKSKPLDITFRLLNDKGGFRWTHWSGSLMNTSHGDDFLFGVIEDVTCKKEAELALINSYERYRMIFEHSPIGIGCFDRTGKIVDCNQYLADLLKVKRDQLIGFNALSSYNPILRGMLKRTLRGEFPKYTGPYTSTISREQVYISATGIPIKDDNERVIAAIALVENMEERRGLELSLRKERDFTNAALESANILLVIADSSGNIQKINRVVAEITKRSESELVGKKIWEVLIQKSDKAAMQKAFSVALTFDKAGPIEINCETKNGAIINVSWTLTSLIDDNNAVDAIVCTGVDITERRKLESQLRTAQKMEAIGRLAGGIAHEFNNLLMAILGQCELLLMDISEEAQLRKKVMAIQKTAKRASKITRNLLAFSKKAPIALGPINLNTVANEVVALLKGWEEDGIKVSIETPSEKLVALADKDLLCQALINILSNAKDSMPNGGSIIIETGKKQFFQDEADRLQLTPGEYCYFKIRDFGCGMSREVLERAFEPFFTTKPFGEGKGLGLFLVHGIAKQLGGKVFIESSVGYGTSVYFYVPAIHEDMDILPNPDGEKVLFNPQPKDFSNLTILLVEDEDMIRETLAGHLESLGARVIKTRLGEEAINILRYSEYEPDLLIADLALLGMDGKRLLKEARAFYPELPGIIISGYPIDIAMDVDLDPELTMFLKKPFSVHDLTRAIKEILSQKLFRYCSSN